MGRKALRHGANEGLKPECFWDKICREFLNRQKLRAFFMACRSQKVTVWLASVKEAKVAVAFVSANTIVLPSPGV